MKRTRRLRGAMASNAGVVGLVLLVGGVVLALYAHQEMAEFETAFGQIGRALSGDAQARYQRLQIMRIGGAVAAAVGLVLAVNDSRG